MIFKGSWCFQFPEASTAKESIRSTKRGSLKVLAVLGAETTVYNCNKLR